MTRAPAPRPSPAAVPAPAGPPRFDALYDEWFPHVVRWARLLGVPDRELEDVAQEVFLVVRRRLVDFDDRNLAGWLFRITQRKSRDMTRTPWLSRLFGRAAAAEIDDLPGDGATPIEALEGRERRRLVDRLCARLTEKRRTVFLLFEVEGYSGEEIAALLGIPLNTVWNRLHYARRDFAALVAALPPAGAARKESAS